MRGRLIVLEALDGVGKTTAARGLARLLGAALMTTPGSDLRAVRGTIDAALADPPLAGALFYAASVLAASAAIEQHLASGRHVVCDRYWLSTLAYAAPQGISLELPQVERALVPADVTLLLTLDEAERRRRLSRRGLSASDRRTLAPEQASRLLASYRGLAEHPVAGRMVELDLTGLSPGAATRRAAVLTREALARPTKGQLVLFPAAALAS